MHTERRLTAEETAWIAAVPCALLTVAAMVWLGGPLGGLLLSTHAHVAFLPEFSGDVFLKPAQQARYLRASHALRH